MNKAESKYFNTARLMDGAFLELLGKKGYEYITVKELCEKAGVNRSTFYLHYESMNDLLLESIEYALKQMKDRFREEHVVDRLRAAQCPIEDLKLVTPRYLIPYLTFVKENKLLFQAAASHPKIFKSDEIFHEMYDEILNPILDRFRLTEKEKKYRMSFYLNGMHALILTWVKGGCEEAVAFITDLLVRCVDS